MFFFQSETEAYNRSEVLNPQQLKEKFLGKLNYGLALFFKIGSIVLYIGWKFCFPIATAKFITYYVSSNLY